MPNLKCDAVADLEAKSQAVSRAIMNEDLDTASTLLQECVAAFTCKQRSPIEVQQYMGWLQQTKSRVLLIRAHLAQRLSQLNRPIPDYRGVIGATWSMKG